MPQLYQMAIVHSGQDTLADEIDRAVRAAAAAVLGRGHLLDVLRDVPNSSPNSHVAVVYVASQDGAQSSAVHAQVNKALRLGFPILPVTRASDEGSIGDSLPSLITQLNAVDWEHDRGLALATIMRILCLVEDERRLFLSYVRRDSAKVADQLHRALQERQFDVFLDRFSVPPGDDFQRRLTEDLADKAFLLLLESDGVRASPWVQYEVNYALSHRIGVLAATMPNVAEHRLAPIDEAFRYRLDPRDVGKNGLTRDALDRLLEQIEVAHAFALRRRREQLLGSLIDHLEAAGCSCKPLADWAIMATADGHTPSAFLVAPRGPRTKDLLALDRVQDRARESTGNKDLAASLVHDVADTADDQTDLLTWVGAPRGLTIRRIFESRLERAA